MCVCLPKDGYLQQSYNLYFIETETKSSECCLLFLFFFTVHTDYRRHCVFQIFVKIFVIEKKSNFKFFIFRVFLKVVKHETKKYIKSFQPVHYNARDIEAQHLHVRNEFHHRRKRRSLADGPKVEIEFNVADRKFELILRGDADVFDDDYEVEDSQGHSLQHRIDHLGPGMTQF